MNRSAVLLNIARVLIFVLIIGAAIWYFASGREFSVEAVLNYTPTHMLPAAAFMLLLYAVKSIAMFLPLMVIQIAVGLYFPTATAIIINIIGMSIELTIPYLLGRGLGLRSTDKLLRKFPKVKNIVEGSGSRWFISYILRAVNMLPLDLVSMYLGSLKIPFPIYFTGSLVGAMFGILAATFIGMSLTDPTSPLFIIACAASITLAGLSALLYYFISNKKEKTDEGHDKR